MPNQDEFPNMFDEVDESHDLAAQMEQANRVNFAALDAFRDISSLLGSNDLNVNIAAQLEEMERSNLAALGAIIDTPSLLSGLNDLNVNIAAYMNEMGRASLTAFNALGDVPSPIMDLEATRHLIPQVENLNDYREQLNARLAQLEANVKLLNERVAKLEAIWEDDDP